MKRGWRHGLWIGAVAVGVRLAWWWLVSNEPTSDQVVYHASAERLATGLGFTHANGDPIGFWPVGYPAYLAAFYAVLGPSPPAAFLANLLLGLSSVAGATVFVRGLFGPAAGWCAGWVAALHPTLVLYTTCWGSENAVFALQPWIGVCFLASLRRREPGPAAGYAVACGVLLGLAGYVRPPTLLAAVALPLAACQAGRGVAPGLARVALSLAVAVLVMLPWGLHNQRTFGVFSLVSLNGNANLWMGNHPGSDGGYHRQLPPEVRGLPIAQREERLGEMAFAFVREEPRTYLALCLKRIALTLRSDTTAVEWNRKGLERRFGPGVLRPLKVLTTAAHWAVLVLLTGWLGVRFVRDRIDGRDAFLLAWVLVSAAPFVLIVGGNRYHLPMMQVCLLWLSAAGPQAWSAVCSAGRSVSRPK